MLALERLCTFFMCRTMHHPMHMCVEGGGVPTRCAGTISCHAYPCSIVFQGASLLYLYWCPCLQAAQHHLIKGGGAGDSEMPWVQRCQSLHQQDEGTGSTPVLLTATDIRCLHISKCKFESGIWPNTQHGACTW